MKAPTMIANLGVAGMWVLAVLFYLEGHLDHATCMCLFAILTRMGPCHD